MVNLKNKEFSSIIASDTKLHAVINSNNLIAAGFKGYISKVGYGKKHYTANSKDKKVYINFQYLVQTSLQGYNSIKGGI